MSGLPCNIDSERFVLGSILLDDAHYVQVAGALSVDAFSLESHRRIFKRMGEVQDRGERIDRVTVYNELKTHSETESVGGLTYLASLTTGLPQIPNIDAYVRHVKDASILCRIIHAAQNVTNLAMLGEESPEAILTKLGAIATDLVASSKTGSEIVSTTELIAAHGVDRLLGMSRGDKAVSLPWPRLDGAINGMQAGQLVVLLGETSRGKSSFALQVAAKVAKQAVPLVWSLEMPARAMFRRLVTQMSSTPLSKASQLTFQEREVHREAVASLGDQPVWFDTRSRSVSAFVSSLHRLRRKARLGAAIVDYLQRIPISNARNRAQDVSENSRLLKQAAMDLEIPILVLSQVDRGSVKTGGEIGLHSAKESGDIENDADVLLWIKAPEFSRDTPTPVKIHVGKQREGPVGFDIEMVFHPATQRFEES